jgi:hypothetical protein
MFTTTRTRLNLMTLERRETPARLTAILAVAEPTDILTTAPVAQMGQLINRDARPAQQDAGLQVDGSATIATPVFRNSDKPVDSPYMQLLESEPVAITVQFAN